jgi:PAS domain S-box-containing protein
MKDSEPLSVTQYWGNMTFQSFNLDHVALEQVMQCNPLTLPHTTSVKVALSAMLQTKNDFILSVDAGRLVGLVTARDVVQALVERGNATGTPLEDLPLSAITTPPIATLLKSEFTDILNLWQRLQQHQIQYLPVTDSQGTVAGVVTRDQLQQVLNPVRMHTALCLLQHTLDSAHAAITSLRLFADQTWEYQYRSPGCEVVFGYTAEELQADPALWRSRVLPEDLEQIILPGFASVVAEQPYTVEYRFQHKDGSLRWITETLASRRDVVTDCWLATIVSTDITEYKRVEAPLRASVQEKEALLAEVYHRVKNNLQLISSLLDLQAMQTGDVTTRAALEDSCSRIYSMSLVHERLYRSRDFAAIPFAGYARELASYLLHTYQPPADSVGFDFNIAPDLYLSLEQAIPCGLILNELVTNSLKYGFSGGRSGQIYVWLEVIGEQHLRLTVGNDGDTLPVNFRMSAQIESMGLKLVLTLVEQLEGTIKLERGDRTLFVIEFPP